MAAAISESGNWLPRAVLNRSGTGNDELGGGSNKEFTSVTLSLLDLVCCFCLRLSNGGRDHVDPRCLFVGLQSKAFNKRRVEQPRWPSFAEVLQRAAMLAGFCLAFRFASWLAPASMPWRSTFRSLFGPGVDVTRDGGEPFEASLDL